MINTADQPGATRRSLSHRLDIDGLRGLAIALVVIFHVFVGRHGDSAGDLPVRTPTVARDAP